MVGYNKYKPSYEQHEDSAPFNMALDTLKRLGEILREIKEISGEVNLPPEIRQARKLNLVKQFFINAVPLLPKEAKDKYKQKILGLEEKKIEVMEKRVGNTSKYKGISIIYDRKLEIELDNLIVNLQNELQKEKYFMPPKSDPRFSWGMG